MQSWMFPLMCIFLLLLVLCSFIYQLMYLLIELINMPYELCKSFDIKSHPITHCFESQVWNSLSFAPSVLLEHPCCAQSSFFSGLCCGWCCACAVCPSLCQPVRARPGDFDSFIHSCALEHLPDIIGFCIPWRNVRCFFKYHSILDDMISVLTVCLWW